MNSQTFTFAKNLSWICYMIENTKQIHAKQKGHKTFNVQDEVLMQSL